MTLPAPAENESPTTFAGEITSFPVSLSVESKSVRETGHRIMLDAVVIGGMVSVIVALVDVIKGFINARQEEKKERLLEATDSGGRPLIYCDLQMLRHLTESTDELDKKLDGIDRQLLQLAAELRRVADAFD